MIIGKKLRELREQKGLLLRQVAAELEVDTAYISKMERGEKNIKREFIVKLAKIYQANTDDLLTLWLADQIYDLVKNEEVALSALLVTEKELKTVSKNLKEK
jgi:transcriptional regulator with XRE-family HTH domain